MLCKTCKIKAYCQVISVTTCEICGAQITTNHMPGYRVCSTCAKVNNICKQCGILIDYK